MFFVVAPYWKLLIDKVWICLTRMGEAFASCDSMKRNLLRSSPFTNLHNESEELSPGHFEDNFTSFVGSCVVCDHDFTKFCNSFRISSSWELPTHILCHVRHLNILTHSKARVWDTALCRKHFQVLSMTILTTFRVWNKIWCSRAISWQQRGT
jgi:hypothetical protein